MQFFIIFLFFSCELLAKQKNLEVFGWPVEEKLTAAQPPLWLGSDPVVGRLSCPSLSRLNVLKKTAEPLVLKTVFEGAAVSASGARSYHWLLGLRTGIYWWTSEPLKAVHLKDFLQNNLNNIIRQKLGPSVVIPKYQIFVQEHGVKLQWESKPSFGPYVLNQAPFWRRADKKSSQKNAWNKVGYECVGNYALEESEQAVVLKPSSSYKEKRGLIVFHKSREQYAARVKHHLALSFDMPASQKVDISIEKDPRKKKQCTNPVRLPVMTAIQWNLASQTVVKADMRKALTMVLPRGTLLRVGAGGWGGLPSALIPRFHPGYHKPSTVRPFSLQKARLQIKKLGYSLHDFPLHNKTDSKQLVIKLGSLVHNQLINKIVIESFESVGIKVVFSADKKPLAELDGQIVGIHLPWPEMNYLQDFHSRLVRVKGSSPGDLVFDRLLEAYALSLTQRKPDFSLLQKIHKYFYDNEMFSLILSHDACLTTNNFSISKNIKVGNPDWFRQVVR